MSGLVVDIVDLPRATGSVKNLQIRTPAPAALAQAAGQDLAAGRLGEGAGQPVEIQEPVRRRSGWSVDPSAH